MFRMSHNVSFDVRYRCGELNYHERAWGNLFPTLMPYGYSVLTFL